MVFDCPCSTDTWGPLAHPAKQWASSSSLDSAIDQNQSRILTHGAVLQWATKGVSGGWGHPQGWASVNLPKEPIGTATPTAGMVRTNAPLRFWASAWSIILQTCDQLVGWGGLP